MLLWSRFAQVWYVVQGWGVQCMDLVCIAWVWHAVDGNVVVCTARLWCAVHRCGVRCTGVVCTSARVWCAVHGCWTLYNAGSSYSHCFICYNMVIHRGGSLILLHCLLCRYFKQQVGLFPTSTASNVFGSRYRLQFPCLATGR